MNIPLEAMPAGVRAFAELPQIATVVQQHAEFDGAGIYDFANTLTTQLHELLPYYHRNKVLLPAALQRKIGSCGHRASMVEVVAAQTPHIVSALIVYPGHVFNIVQSTVTGDSVVIENDREGRVGDIEDDISNGVFLLYPIFKESSEGNRNEYSLIADNLKQLKESTDAKVRFAKTNDVKTGQEKVGNLGPDSSVCGTIVSQRIGLSALRFIEQRLV